MLMLEILDWFWLKLVVDLFEYEKYYYLLVVDYFFKWFEVIKLENLLSKIIVNCLKELFLKYGFIDEMIIDNGFQFFFVDFKDFLFEFEFKYVISSLYYV